MLSIRKKIEGYEQSREEKGFVSITLTHDEKALLQELATLNQMTLAQFAKQVIMEQAENELALYKSLKAKKAHDQAPVLFSLSYLLKEKRDV
ncbi:DUF6290 family protein [Streptococcus sp.]|nr:DUF6290 family protein [Streptococcus sp.]MDY3823362.1 DUF6290 family protein [Streptococcus sp.]